MTMTRKEIAVLLAMIAAYDQRTVGELDVEAWHAVAGAEGWQPDHARRAVVEFHSANADRGRMRPPHVSDAIRAVRDRVSQAVRNANPVTPRDVDPVAWFREYVTKAQQAALDTWANGDPLPNLDDPRAVQRLTEGPNLRAIEGDAA